MKKLVILMIVIGFGLTGCGLTEKKVQVGNVMESNRVEIRGQMSTKVGDEWVFIKEGGETLNITSQKVNLDEYEGQTITVEGMYSGSTLYVDVVK